MWSNVRYMEQAVKQGMAYNIEFKICQKAYRQVLPGYDANSMGQFYSSSPYIGRHTPEFFLQYKMRHVLLEY